MTIHSLVARSLFSPIPMPLSSVNIAIFLDPGTFPINAVRYTSAFPPYNRDEKE